MPEIDMSSIVMPVVLFSQLDTSQLFSKIDK